MNVRLAKGHRGASRQGNSARGVIRDSIPANCEPDVIERVDGRLSQARLLNRLDSSLVGYAVRSVASVLEFFAVDHAAVSIIRALSPTRSRAAAITPAGAVV